MFETILGRRVFVPAVFEIFAGVPQEEVHTRLRRDFYITHHNTREAEKRRHARQLHGSSNPALALRSQDAPQNAQVILDGRTSIGILGVLVGVPITMHFAGGTFITGPWAKDVQFVPLVF